MPSWVKDKDKWDDAKKIANFEYDLNDDDPKYWKIVAGIYKKMGGGLQKAGTEQKMTKSIMLFFHKADHTHAKVEAGNYKKRIFEWNGLTINVESPAGVMRKNESSGERMLIIHQRKAGAWDIYDEEVGSDRRQIIHNWAEK